MNDEKIVSQVVEHHNKKEIKKTGETGITWWQLSLIGIGSIIGAAFSTFVGALFTITNVLSSLSKDHDAPKIVMRKN